MTEWFHLFMTESDTFLFSMFLGTILIGLLWMMVR